MAEDVGRAPLTEINLCGLPHVHIAHTKVSVAVGGDLDALAGVILTGKVKPIGDVPLMLQTPHVGR